MVWWNLSVDLSISLSMKREYQFPESEELLDVCDLKNRIKNCNLKPEIPWHHLFSLNKLFFSLNKKQNKNQSALKGKKNPSVSPSDYKLKFDLLLLTRVRLLSKEINSRILD